MLSLLPSALVLGAAAVAALFLARARRSPQERLAERDAAARALAVAAAVQALHFAEEAVTDFPERLGGQFGLPSMSFSFFVVFNLFWLGVWVAAVPGLRSSRTYAFFAAWFLAIAGIINGVAHPLLALAAGGYFPGLVTSPFVAVVCIMLLLRLRGATDHE